jgi:putative transposase
VGFGAALAEAAVQVKHAPFRSPNTVAFVERFVQTIQQECLDHFIVFGSSHMDHLCREFVEHCHAERPHQGKDNELLRPPRKQKHRAAEASTLSLREVHCKQRLGGLLKHYHRAAA